MKKYDNVNHPQHYISMHGLEVIDIIEEFTRGLSGIEAADTGNIIKYILRWDKKGNPVEDLEKAQWCLNHLIARVKARPTDDGRYQNKPAPTMEDVVEMDDKEFEKAMNEMELEDLKSLKEEMTNAE